MRGEASRPKARSGDRVTATVPSLQHPLSGIGKVRPLMAAVGATRTSSAGPNWPRADGPFLSLALFTGPPVDLDRAGDLLALARLRCESLSAAVRGPNPDEGALALSSDQPTDLDRWNIQATW